ncbi:MAG: hypothetical protein HY591_05185, partial [Candidatus Omnitrophica bacterium]|nr:hypothetical protein [Candidatus Omnitrophota bacterium]
MIPEQLGQTELGRDMLAQDYMLKQLTASLIYPEKELGKNFWDKVYAQAQQRYGTTQVPVNTFNKVWILPDKAGVFVRNNTAYVVEGHLKVMLEEDYLAREKNSSTLSSPNVSVGGPVHASPGFPTKAFGNDKNATSQIVRQIILPAIENEVNTAKNFAPLRQIFYSLVLASWYKKNLKQALLNQVYSDKNKINGVDADDKQIGQKIYQQYLAAYKKGVFNYIKEDASTALSTGVDHLNKQSLPRKYFSGGEVFSNFDLAMFTNPANPIVQRGLPTGPQLYVSAAVKNAGPDAAMIGSVTAERVSLERQRVYAASQGSHEQRRVAEFEYVRNRFGDESLKRELGVDYVGLYNFFIGQVRSNGDLEITREIADRFKESLWEIAINQLDGHVRKVRVRTNYNDPELGSSDEDTGDAHVIYFPLASNPLHSGQIETALRAMAQSKASQVVFRVQGLDFRKEITGATIDGRHEITDGFMRELSKFAPGLFAYSAIGKENDLDGETDYLNFLKLNAGRKGKLRVDYLVGSDHMHYWDKQGRPDTIQKFEKFADEQAEFLRDHNIRFMVLFNERDPQDSKPRPNEEAKLQELKSKGFYILLRGANLEGASSTLIRNALAGFGKAEDLTIMPLYVEQQIKERGKYRGFIVGLPEAISHLA